MSPIPPPGGAGRIGDTEGDESLPKSLILRLLIGAFSFLFFLVKLGSSKCMYPYISHMYSYVARMYPYVVVCFSYVTCMLPVCTRMYSYVTRMYSCVPVCHSYVTRVVY